MGFGSHKSEILKKVVWNKEQLIFIAVFVMFVGRGRQLEKESIQSIMHILVGGGQCGSRQHTFNMLRPLITAHPV